MDGLPRPPGRLLRGALASASYRAFTIGNAISLVGYWTQRVSAGWLAWELTQSPVWLGLIAFADLFPTLLLGPLAGAVADRTDQLGMIKLCQWLAIAPSVALLILSIGGWLEIWGLFALTAALGVIQSFSQPARLALVGELVERRDLPAAVAINSISFNLARFAGPALAGFCIVTLGVWNAFALAALSQAVCIAMLERVHTLHTPTAGAAPTRFASDLMAGIRYTFLHPGFVIAFTLITTINVCVRPILDMLPAFAVQLYGSDAGGFALLASAVGAGAMAGGLWMAMDGRRLRLSTMGLVSAAMIALVTLAIAALSALWAATIGIAVLGFFLATSSIAIQSLVQLSAETNMRGRALSIYGMLFRAGPALGGLLMGSLGQTFGLRLPTVATGLIVAAVTLWALLRRRILVETMEARLPER